MKRWDVEEQGEAGRIAPARPFQRRIEMVDNQDARTADAVAAGVVAAASCWRSWAQSSLRLSCIPPLPSRLAAGGAVLSEPPRRPLCRSARRVSSAGCAGLHILVKNFARDCVVYLFLATLNLHSNHGNSGFPALRFAKDRTRDQNCIGSTLT